MPESTPLLPRSNRPPHEHPIFLRVCHSPWYFLGQRALLLLRGLIATYMTAVLAVAIDYERCEATHGELFIYKAGLISFVVQIIYYWITALWTLQHLFWPRYREDSDDGLLTRLKNIFSIPRTTAFNAKNRLAFSVFYTCVTTFPYVVTFLYWFVLNDGTGHVFESGPIQAMMHVNMYGIGATIALVETMILSSVRKQQPFTSHIVGLLLIVGLYFVWTAVGHAITHEYVYKQLNPDYNGMRGVIMTIVTTMSVTTAFLLISLGLHGVRDYATAKAECDRQNP
ncbi:hypothetical protein MMC17_008750 [Xylographa soralifera]|nr:hypothetical protein [Xylographa soralifera]